VDDQKGLPQKPTLAAAGKDRKYSFAVGGDANTDRVQG
jgi:hypothetical protein